MERDRRLSLTVGGFALAGLAALAVAILSLSAERGLFTARYRLLTYFDNVQGLVAGASVRLAGTQVGQVEQVAFAQRPSGEPALLVTLRVDESVQERIRGDSVAQITTVGLLGDQIVEITIGTQAAEVLSDGEELPTLDPLDLSVLVSRGGQALDAIQALASNLNETLDEFRQGTSGEELAASLGSLGEMVSEVRSGDGVLHNLIYEPYEGTAVASLESSLASLANLLAEIERGDGVLHTLVYDAPAEQDVVLEFLGAGARLNSILDKIDRGEGTMGLLLNDPTLYEEVKLLVGGANRSTVVRSLIRLVTEEE